MDIAKDLAGTEHYAGHARRNAEGEYYIEGLEESSCLWNESSLWQESLLWNESFLWSESDLSSSSIAINTWVDQE